MEWNGLICKRMNAEVKFSKIYFHMNEQPEIRLLKKIGERSEPSAAWGGSEGRRKRLYTKTRFETEVTGNSESDGLFDFVKTNNNNNCNGGMRDTPCSCVPK